MSQTRDPIGMHISRMTRAPVGSATPAEALWQTGISLTVAGIPQPQCESTGESTSLYHGA